MYVLTDLAFSGCFLQLSPLVKGGTSFCEEGLDSLNLSGIYPAMVCMQLACSPAPACKGASISPAACQIRAAFQ